MADPIKMLKSLEEALEKAKLDKANLEGQKESILKELMEVYEVSDIESGTELLNDYDTEIASLETKVTEMAERASKLLAV